MFVKEGEKYGRLTVIERDYDKEETTVAGIPYWICKCECDNTKTVRQDHLVNGKIQSCGCLHVENGRIQGKLMGPKIAGHNAMDLTGKRFGNLTVISLYSKGDNSHSRKWLCKCDCGAQTIVLSVNLLSGHTVSCGCIMSGFEKKVGEILTNHGYKFTKNQTFPDCKFDNDTFAKFDFFVNNHYIIECDGLQHFKDNMFSNSTLDEISTRDKIKNEWCRIHNIPIIRIPYTIQNTVSIDDLKLDTSKYVLFKHPITYEDFMKSVYGINI